MIRIRQIKIPITSYKEEHLKKYIANKIKCKESDITNVNIVKKSIDARQKPNIYYILEVDITTPKEQIILKQKSNDIIITPDETYKYPSPGDKKLNNRPIIVGSGPAGLFCAYLLAELGYKPIIIERGEKVDERVKTVNTFWNTGKLNSESNVQFGEGGAGTFSDGKLNTMTHDKEHRHKKVFETFVENGANPEIFYLQNPHIGTDILRNVIKNIRNKIIDQGGTFYYSTCLSDINIQDNKVVSIEINHKEIIETDILVLAIGHSARDTFKMLLTKGINLQPKPFAVGLRIQHSQETINKSQYGENYKLLPPASYKLTYQTKSGRGVYSFCMCPGGYVVNASSEPGRLAINGMSNHKRDTTNANSALVVTVGPKDYGSSPLDGMNYQRTLEEKAYNLGNGKIPIQLLKDFNNNNATTKLGDLFPVLKGDYQLSNLNEILPDYISNSIKEAIPNFAKKIKYFDKENTILAGIESRTSSPIRIPRDENFESNITGIYPCGEGAGYSGGITTSAIDGIKVAEAIISTYKITNWKIKSIYNKKEGRK